MPIVVLTCIALIAATTLIHYEALRFLSTSLDGLFIPDRFKVLVVIFCAFFAHALEIAVYGGTEYLLVKYFGVGGLNGTGGLSYLDSFYFSAETYTSLGFGDLTPSGPVRLLAGVEALNGLLLIAWSASFTYIAMERFWRNGKGPTAARD